MEIGNVLQKEFRIIIVKISRTNGEAMEKMQEMFTKDPEELKNKQTEMNNTLEGINSRIIDAEGQKSDLKDRMVEITAAKQNIGGKNEKNTDSLRDIWDIKCTSIHITEGPKEEREKGPKKIFEEIIAENLSNVGKEIVSQLQEA